MLLMVAKVCTVNVPASLTEFGFVPPVLNVKENADPPLEKVPEAPNGLVRVTVFPDTKQLAEVETGVVGFVTVHMIFCRAIELGKLTLIFDALGME